MDSSYAACRNNGTAIEGSDILEKLNVSRTVGENVGVLFLFVAIFRILTYLSLRYLHKPKWWKRIGVESEETVSGCNTMSKDHQMSRARILYDSGRENHTLKYKIFLPYYITE